MKRWVGQARNICFSVYKSALDAGIFDPSERDRDADFAFGLERILDGIERLVAERTGGEREARPAVAGIARPLRRRRDRAAAARKRAAGRGEGSDAVRTRVVSARLRLAEAPPARTPVADELLTRAVERLRLSGRGRAKVASVRARSPRSRRPTRFCPSTSRRRCRVSRVARPGGMTFLPRTELPPLLRAIHDPPQRLHLRGVGGSDLLARPAVAVVGARAYSPYGARVARMLGRDLAAAGVVVVSGLARGVDGEAHRGALQTDGHTVAVLGNSGSSAASAPRSS